MADNILFLADCLYGNAGGGTERQFLKLYKYLATVDIDVHVAFLRHEPVHDTLDWRSPYYQAEINSVWRLSALQKIRSLIEYIDDHAIKLVQTFYDDSAIIGAIIKKLRPDIHVVGSLRNNGHAHTALKRFQLSWAFNQLDHVLINASIISEYLSNTLKVKSNNITTIYNILEPSKEKPLSDTDRQTYSGIKDKFGLIATTVANLKPVKGTDDLLRAIALLGNDSIAFCLIGDSSLADHYKTMSNDLGISKQVFFLGRKDNIPAHLNQSDILILPSRSEGLSNSLIEYLIADKPIIATDVGGNSEILEDGKLGTLVKGEDPKHLSSAIAQTITLLNNNAPETNNKSLVEGKYGITAICEKYRTVYESIWS